MERLQHICDVISNETLCPAFYRMVIDAPDVAREVNPGQFIHIRTSDSLEPFFRRPFSVYRTGQYIEIFYEAVGPGTRLLSLKKTGDKLDIIGPVGKPFILPKKHVKNVVMIAGGIGIAPFLMLSDELKKKDLNLILLYGGRTKDHVYEMKEFKENGVSVYVATNDGSVGAKGFVSEHFDKIPLGDETWIYTCGPNPMMQAVQSFAAENNIKGQAACEEIMACALGACLGCSIPTKNGFKTVCYDGPVFDLQDVIFDQAL